MENQESKIYSEVYSLIKLLGDEYENMLSSNVKETIEKKRDKHYSPVYSLDIPLEKQNIHTDSMAILANIQYNYWCTTSKEKADFLNELRKNDIDIENKSREMYNPDNIFKKTSKKEEKENLSLMDFSHSDNLINKFIKFFKKIFHIRRIGPTKNGH